jgi:hypothetical protein
MENLSNAVFVFDNESRNKEIVNRMEKIVERGYKVCVWPSKLVEKDINDMIMSGMTAASIELIINNNTVEGLQGKLAISMWRRC